VDAGLLSRYVDAARIVNPVSQRGSRQVTSRDRHSCFDLPGIGYRILFFIQGGLRSSFIALSHDINPVIPGNYRKVAPEARQ
jgi:hypothetical protein